MLEDWLRVQKSEEYWNYTPEQRGVIKAAYFKKHVANTPEFQSRTEEQKAAILNGFSKYGDDVSPERTFWGTLGDLGLSVTKGLVGTGQAVVGLADLASGGHAGKALEESGVDLKGAQDYLSSNFSPAQKAANERVQKAEGFLGTAAEMIKNPSTIVMSGAESLPSMVGGGLLARGGLAVGAKVIPKVAKALQAGSKTPGIIAGAAGEGVVGMGQSAEDIRQQTPGGLLSINQIPKIAGSGIGTTIFGAVGGRLAQRFGFADPDTMLATIGKKVGREVPDSAGVMARIFGGGISEGLFEELPQSVQETIWQNAALGKPLMEGVPEAAATGFLVGGAMGAGANLLSRKEAESNIGKAENVDQAIDAFNEATKPELTSPEITTGPKLGDALLNDPIYRARVENQANMDRIMRGAGDIVQPAEPVQFPGQTAEEQQQAQADILNQRQQVAIERTREAVRQSGLVKTGEIPGQTVDPTQQAREVSRLETSKLTPPVITTERGPTAFADELQKARARAQQTAQVDQQRKQKESQRGSYTQSVQERAVEAQRRLKEAERTGVEIDPSERRRLNFIIEAAKQAPREPVDYSKMRETGRWTEPARQDQVPAATMELDTPETPPAALPPGQGGESLEAPESGGTSVEKVSIDTKANEAASSPLNDKKPPTPKQIDANNAELGHVRVHGLQVSIENPEGSVRSEKPPKDAPPDWKPSWSRKISGAHYGYIRGTEAGDGDAVDVFVAPGKSDKVYVIDQVNPKTGKFDEPKVVTGAQSEAEAREIYLSNYEEGWQGLGAITEMPVLKFKQWIKGGKKNRPVGKLPQSGEGIAKESKKQPWEMKADEITPHMVARNESKIAELQKEADALAATAPDVGQGNLTRKSKHDSSGLNQRQKWNGKNGRILSGIYQQINNLKEVNLNLATDEGKEKTRTFHKDEVKKAIASGKKVSPEVLAGYPDLSPTVKRNLTVEEKDTPQAMTEEEYLSRIGLSRQDIGESALHKNRGGKSDKQWTKTVGAQAAKDRELIAKRETARKDYADKIASGELRSPTRTEQLIRTAQGHEDNQATMAARRVLKKRGIEWEPPVRQPAPVQEKRTAPESELERLQSEYDAAKSALDAIGPEPRNPSNERQYFGQRGREGAPPESIAQYDADVKKHAAWRRKYSKLKDAEVAASNKLFRSKKQKPGAEADTTPQAAADQFNTQHPGNQVTFDGVQEQGIPGKPDFQSFTFRDGPLKGMSFNLLNPTPEAIKSKLDEMVDTRAKLQAKLKEQEQTRQQAKDAGIPQRDIDEAEKAGIRDSQAEEEVAAEPESGEKPSEKEVSAPSKKTKAATYPPRESKDKVKDSGLELWYNKRNRMGNGIKWDDVKDLNETLKTKEVTKSKVWPRPNYEQLVDDGMFPFSAHLLKQVYDTIPAKPQSASDEHMQTFIEEVQKARDAIFEWAKDRSNAKALLDSLMPAAKAAAGRGPVSLMSLANSNKALFDAVFPNYINSDFRRGGKYHAAVNALGGNKFLRAIQVGMDEAKRAVKDLDLGWPKPAESWQRQGIKVSQKSDVATIKDFINYADETRKRVFNVMIGRRQYSEPSNTKEEAQGIIDGLKPWLVLDKYSRVIGQHDTQEAATEAARSKVKKERGSKITDFRITSSEATRKGPEHRAADEDITPDRLRETFGFKGINFGNWTNQKERQASTNAAYDAFLDLADMMGVPPKAMSLDGLLGVAFGAQGTGAHGAHFVPGVNEINLTKTKGAGALAHEWAHAVDHYFSNQAGLSRSTDPYLTHHTGPRDTGKGIGDGIRPEIVRAFKRIVTVMKQRPATAEELAQMKAERRARDIKGLTGWANVIRKGLEQNAQTDEKEQALKDFDELTDRLKNGDMGEGYALSGKMNLPQVVAQMRNLVRDKAPKSSGDITDNWKALSSWASTLAYQAKAKESDKAHIPQISTEYAKGAAALDKEKKGKAYWTEPTEMFARAFETFIVDKLEDNARRNDYLSYPVNDEEGQRYPTGSERKFINQAIGELVDSLKTKETDRGVALFSRRAPQAETEAFKKWFRGSKVVDENGEPLVVYHSTTVDFEKFKRSRSDIGFHFGTIEQAEDRTQFLREIGSKRTAEPERIMPVYLSIKNPLRMDDIGSWRAENIYYELNRMPQFRGKVFNNSTLSDIRAALRAAGYDGIVYKNTGETAGAGPYREKVSEAKKRLDEKFPKQNSYSLKDQESDEYKAWRKTQEDYTIFRGENAQDSYIALEPTQVKSAIGNRGTFSPKDPNILYSMRPPGGKGTQKAPALQSTISSITAHWSSAPKVQVVQSQSELPGDILDHLKAIGAENDIVDGTFYQGTVYLVADNLASEKAAVNTLLHESFGHYGLRELLGERFKMMLMQVYASHKAEIQPIADEYGFDTTKLKDRILAADEWLSRHVSENEQSSWIDKIISAIRAFVRRIAPNLKFSDAEIRNLLDAARSRVVGTSPTLAGAGSGASILDPAFAKAYHGTPHIWPAEKGFPHGRPRLDKIGTGEGAAAYGWGFYLADAMEVGKGYRDALQKPKGMTNVEIVNDLYLSNYSIEDGLNKAVGELFGKEADYSRLNDEEAEQAINHAIEKGFIDNPQNMDASLYELDIPDEVIPKLLDWDAPLSAQPKIKELWEKACEWALGRKPELAYDITGAEAYDMLSAGGLGGSSEAAGKAAKRASEALAKFGVPGNKYLDGMSRNKGKGSYNYVIWDQKVLDRIALLERNGEKLDAMREAEAEPAFKRTAASPPAPAKSGPSYADTLGPVTDADYIENRSLKRNFKMAAESNLARVTGEITEGLDKYLGSISTRLGNISAKLRDKLRSMDFAIGRQHTKDVQAVEPLLRKVKKAMTREDYADWDYARKNSDVSKINELIEKYDLRKEYDAYRKVLDRIHDEAYDVGLVMGKIEEYAPRILKDSRGFLKAIGKGKDWAIYTRRLKEKAKELGLSVEKMNPDQRAQIISQMILSGQYGLGGPPATKQRKLEKIPAPLNQYYMDSDSALMAHIYGMRKAIEGRKFFGRIPQNVAEVRKRLFTVQTNMRKLQQQMNGLAQDDEQRIKLKKRWNKLFGLEKEYQAYIETYALNRDFKDYIGAYIDELVINHEIKDHEQRTVNEILNARFHERGTYGIVQTYKNFSYLDTMGSVTSALTQIGDLSWVAYEVGLIKALKYAYRAARKSSRITKEDVGIERVAQEFEDATTLGKAVSKVFKLVGLEKIDSIGKESLLNAAHDKFRERARREPGKLRAQIEPMFGAETDSVIQDLLDDQITENVKLLVYARLLDFQPVALSEMSEKYLNAGNGRVFYMLKTFTLKQFDVYRREVYNKLRYGDRSEKIQAIKNLTRLSMFFVLANAGADELKDWVLGRTTDFEDRAVDNMLRLFGVSKFITWQARTEGVGTAMAKQILPPFKFINAVSRDITSDKEGSETLASIPVVGKLAYWHMGAGVNKREDLWDSRLRKEKSRLNSIKDRMEEADNINAFRMEHSDDLNRLDQVNSMQYKLNQYRKRISRMEKMEPTAERKAFIEKLKERRIALIKQFLKEK